MEESRRDFNDSEIDVPTSALLFFLDMTVIPTHPMNNAWPIG
jgi:hypothetical protein